MSTTDQTTAARLVDVDPATLTLDANIRTTAVFDPKRDPADAEFAASIAAHGVLVPIVATPGPDGALRVIYGQRRTLAAIHTARATVPVHVIDDVDDTARILGQRAENHDRKPLGTSDEAAGFAQLAAIGLTAEQIATAGGIKTDRVETLLRVAKAKTVLKAAARYDLTVDQAAALEEFHTDTATLKHLTETAADDPARFEHAVERARQERDEKASRAEVTASLEKRGVRIVDSPGYGSNTKASRLSELKDLTEPKHRKCPGHAAYVAMDWQGEKRIAKAAYVCTDWAGNGHQHKYYSKPAAGAAGAGAPADAGEAEKAARRLVIERNKAMTAATVVRRKWLAELATLTSAPVGAEAFIARQVASPGRRFKDALEGFRTEPWTILATVLGYAHKQGVKGDTPVKFREAIDRASAKRATLLTVLRICTAIESNLPKDSWRGVDGEARDYFTMLKSWGYSLSEVEELFLGETDLERAGASETVEDLDDLDLDGEDDEQDSDEGDGVEDVVDDL